MHTSRFMRVEATKLFFSDPAAVYIIDAEWLLQGGYPGDTLYELGFMLHIERLYVDFRWMKARTWMDPADSGVFTGTEEEGVTCGSVDENIRKFWSTVQQRFPRLKYIMLGDAYKREELRETSREPPISYRKVSEMCPEGIEVSVALYQGGDKSTRHRIKRGLWQLATSQMITNNGNAQWEKSSSWHDPLIVMPYRVLRGPVGRFQDFQIRREQEIGQYWVIQMCKIAAVEKYYFEGRHCSFRCSVNGCTTIFEQPEEYTSHVIETRHEQIVPQPFNILFEENDRRLERLKKDISERQHYLQDWGGSEGSIQRQIAEKEVMHQLETDVLYAQDTPVSEHNCLKTMHRVFGELHL